MKNEKNQILIASLALCLLSISAGQVFAFGGIANSWRQQYPDVCPDLKAASQDCSLCHFPDDSFNPYGKAVKDANYNFLAIENDDSDGDGRTNGQEINLDCTLPGDAGSVPAKTVAWGQIKALYR